MENSTIKQILMNFQPTYRKKRLNILTSIGSGSYSTVFHALFNHQPLVAKKFSENNIEKINKEVTALLGLQNFPNFIQFVSFLCHHDSFYIISQNHGSPLHLDQKFSKIQLKTLFFKLFYQITILNALSLTHRDIKPENILLDDNLSPTLIDFGLVLPLTKSLQRAGTKQYQPPENFISGASAENSDAYSLIIIFCNIALKEKIAFSTTRIDQLRRYKQIFGREFSDAIEKQVILTEEELSALRSEKQILMSSRVSKCSSFTHLTVESMEMIEKVLVMDPKSRLSGLEVLNLDYFKEVRGELVGLKYLVEVDGCVQVEKQLVIDDFKANCCKWKGEFVV